MTEQSKTGKSTQADVHDLIEAVRVAKQRRDEHEAAKGALAIAVGHIQDLIGGDALSAIANGERRVGEILTRHEVDG